MSAITPLGNNIESTWANLIKGLSGVGPITRFDPSLFPSRIAGEVKGFAPASYVPRKDVKRLDPFIHYAAASTLMALEDAGLTLGQLKSRRTAIIFGSSRGGMRSIEEALKRHFAEDRPFSAYLMSSSTINMAASYVSILLASKGPTIGISTACASGANAIGLASRMIRSGEVDLAAAGGTEAPICRLAIGGYSASGALSRKNDHPAEASRPFDLGRDGFVISEGAGTLILEDLQHAANRGVPIYAEISGYATGSDAFHLTQPDSLGEATTIENALKDAHTSTEEVDYINAHATSTLLGDRAEAEAIRRVWGTRTKDIPISACKSMLGHMLGAAGAVEAAITALSIKEERIPPTINLDQPDPACILQHVTSAIPGRIRVAVSHSFGFGGVNAVLVLRRFDK